MSRLIPPLVVAAIALGTGGLVWALTAPGTASIALGRQQLADLTAEAAALESRIAEFNSAGDGSAMPGDLLLPGAGAADASLALQQRLVDLAAGHDLALSSFGDAPTPAALTHPAVSVQIDGEGRLQDVTAFLDALEHQTPRIGISQLLLRAPSIGDGNAEARVILRLSAWGFFAEGAAE